MSEESEQTANKSSQDDFSRAFAIIQRLDLHDGLEFASYQEQIHSVTNTLNSEESTTILEEGAKLSKALGHVIRLRLLAYLMYIKRTCLCELGHVLGLDPSALTYHIKLLQEAKLVNVEKRGREKLIELDHSFYSFIPPATVIQLQKIVSAIEKSTRTAN